MRIALLFRALGALVGLVGCAYKPGSFASSEHAFSGQRASQGCLDVAIERRADLPIGPVLEFQFANRCDHMTTVDLGSVAVVGRNAQGTDVALRPYDPRREIHPVPLDGRKEGGEALVYPADRSMPQVCVDVATLAKDGSWRWLCFGSAPTVVGGVP